MSVLIKGFPMPQGCSDCEFVDYYKHQWYCPLIKDTMIWVSNERNPRCPLVEVPTPHGPLIDADELIAGHNGIFDNAVFPSDIRAEPVIIPAEKEGE